MNHNKKIIYFLLVIFLIIVNNLRLKESFKNSCDSFFNNQDYKNFANSIFNSKNQNVYIFEKNDNKTGIYKNKICVNQNCLTDNDIEKINQKLADNLIT